MELYHLRTFVAVAREGHLTRAAEKLFLSQPAVSAHIKALEEELGVRLFERTPRGMRTTPDGEALLPRAQEALAAAAGLLQHARGLQGELGGSIRIGTITDPFHLQLGKFIAAMASRFPRVRLRFRQGVSGSVFQGVRDGDLDAGYVLGDYPDPRVAAVELKKERLRIVAPRAWKDRVEEADWPQLALLPWILTPPQCSFHQITRRLFQERRTHPERIVEADQEATVKSLLASEAGLSLMREEPALRGERAEELVVWKKEAYETALSFVYPEERKDEPLVKAAVEVVCRVWRE